MSERYSFYPIAAIFFFFSTAFAICCVVVDLQFIEWIAINVQQQWTPINSSPLFVSSLLNFIHQFTAYTYQYCDNGPVSEQYIVTAHTRFFLDNGFLTHSNGSFSIFVFVLFNHHSWHQPIRIIYANGV